MDEGGPSLPPAPISQRVAYPFNFSVSAGEGQASKLNLSERAQISAPRGTRVFGALRSEVQVDERFFEPLTDEELGLAESNANSDP